MKPLIYAFSGAPRPWRAMLGLLFKNIEFDVHWVQNSKQEHKSPEFLKLNPRATLPVLVCDEHILTDSIGILAWLDQHFTPLPLFGTTSTESGFIWNLTMEMDDYLRKACDQLVRPLFFGNQTEVDSALEQAAETMHEELSQLEQLLVRNCFLAGDHPSAADALAFPEIRIVKRAIETKTDIMAALGFATFADRYPKVNQWVQSIEAFEHYHCTFPYHWEKKT
jgi:glutathione S-transferase